MLTCRDMTEIVTDYLEGRMTFATRMKFHMHLAMCKHCREYVRQVKLVARSLGRLPAEDEMPRMSDETRAEMLKHFRGWKGRE